MNEKKKLFAVGEILWDVFPGGKKLGGAVCNVAYISRQLGVDAKIVSAVGDDSDGREILDIITDEALPTDYLEVLQDRPTSRVDVELDDDGKPEYIIHENVAWDYILATEKLLDEVKTADAICFGSLAQRSEVSRENIQKIISNHKPGALRVFDINLRQSFYSRQTIERCLELCNVLKLNDEELPVLAEYFDITGSVEDIIREIMARFEINITAYTQGSKGATLYDTSGSYTSPCPKVEVVDTVGAGDSFTATLIASLLQDKSLAQAVSLATKVAAYVCQQAGGTVNLPEHILNMFE